MTTRVDHSRLWQADGGVGRDGGRHGRELQKGDRGTPRSIPEIPDRTARIYVREARRGEHTGRSTTTSPSASYGLAPVRMDRVPMVDYGRTGRHHRVDRAVLQRRQLDAATDGGLREVAPDDLVDDAISVKTCGYSSRCSPVTWTRYVWTSWRFLSAIETTSIATARSEGGQDRLDRAAALIRCPIVEIDLVPGAWQRLEPHPAAVLRDRPILWVGIQALTGSSSTGRSARNCSRYKRAYRPPCASSSACVPPSTIRPRS